MEVFKNVIENVIENVIGYVIKYLNDFIYETPSHSILSSQNIYLSSCSSTEDVDIYIKETIREMQLERTFKELDKEFQKVTERQREATTGDDVDDGGDGSDENDNTGTIREKCGI